MASFPITVAETSRGFAALTPAARAEGRSIRDAAAAAIAAVLGVRVGIEARPMPGRFVRSLGVARLSMAVGELGSTASLEADAGLLARTLERLAGHPGFTPAAIGASDLERALLALVALVAIDGAATAGVAKALGARVRLEGAEPARDGLAIALDITVGDDHGRGQLLVPEEAVARLGSTGVVEPSEVMAAVKLDASFRRGTASLALDDLDALAPGDVVLLDERSSPTVVVLPGGLTLRGEEQGSVFHVQEIHMTEAQAAYPLVLSVELARVTLTFGELARVEPGATLPLDLRKDGGVVLRAGERAVARGQLVDIDGGLGVRIAQVGDGGL